MKLLLYSILTILLTSNMALADKITGTIIEEGTDKPIVGAKVKFGNKIINSNQDGDFELPADSSTNYILFEAYGYKVTKVSTKELKSSGNIIELSPISIKHFDDIIVYDSPESEKVSRAKKRHSNLDNVLPDYEGINMISRANFAHEPVIRGQSGERATVTIDGMKVFPACVDNMDPISSYVEMNNFKKIEVSRGGFEFENAKNSSGALNFITQKPEFDRSFYSMAQTGYESAKTLRFLNSTFNISHNNLALRGAFDVKKSDFYYAGNNKKIDNSGFEKNNIKLDLSWKPEKNHKLLAGAIIDNAYEVGYPALIMDAARAQARMYSIDHKWGNPAKAIASINSKIYYNTVDHYMDDYSRDVTQREVMRNMYMPMFGYTKTAGLKSEAALAGKKHTLKIGIDSYYLNAFADMEMISVFDTVPNMYLYNIADAGIYDIGFHSKYSRILSNSLIWDIAIRADYSNRSLNNKDGKNTLSAFTGIDNFKNNFYSFNISSSIEKEFNSWTGKLTLSRTSRMPSHKEAYGYFLYNPLDGYFYFGNPNLKNEKSCQAEIAASNNSERYKFRGAAFMNYLTDYIYRERFEEDYVKYTNIENALMTGFELYGEYTIIDLLKIQSKIDFVYAQNLALEEPLPMIPPMRGSASLFYGNGSYWGEFTAAFSLRQTRIAESSTREDETQGFTILHLRAGAEVADWLQLNAGIENILDNLYHEHISVENLPAPGRNFYLRAKLLFN